MVVARGGLRASQACSFVEANQWRIERFRPTHVVLHVYYWDMVPRSLEEKVPTPKEVLGHISATMELLKTIIPGVTVMLSEPLPHCIAHFQPEQYPDWDVRNWNSRWRSYNKTVRYLRDRNFNNIIPFIPHERLWLSVSAANPIYYDFSPNEKCFGLHLNQAGSNVLVEDILAALP